MIGASILAAKLWGLDNDVENQESLIEVPQFLRLKFDTGNIKKACARGAVRMCF